MHLARPEGEWDREVEHGSVRLAERRLAVVGHHLPRQPLTEGPAGGRITLRTERVLVGKDFRKTNLLGDRQLAAPRARWQQGRRSASATGCRESLGLVPR